MNLDSLKIYVVVFLTIFFVGCGGSSSSGGDDQENDVLLCDDGFVLEEDTQSCVVELTCDSGFTLNDSSDECVSICTDIQEWDETLETCIDYHVCVAGTEYPEGYIPSEFSTQDDCQDIPFQSGPAPEYFPEEDEVVIYLNKQHVDGVYDDYYIHRWGQCWLSTPAYPGLPLFADGVDPYYGAYFVFPIDAECSSAPTSFLIHGSGDQSDDLTIDVQSSGFYARMAWLITGDEGQLRSSNGAQFGTAAPICLTEPSSGDECVAPEAP